ncbi:MAG TPA: hypothetical protein VFS88_00525 [Micavibrio sp.]|nr:hypothetical protein [Micavibrio sp.]
MPEKKWSIWLAERPVVANAKKDTEKYGRPFSHPFLILKDCFDTTRGEIHGTWGNWPRRGLSDKPGKLFDHFTGAVCNNRTAYAVSKVTRPVYPLAVLCSLDDKFIPRPNIEKQKVCSGERQRVMERWTILKEAFPHMNAYRLPFFRYAMRGSGLANCQIMLRAALEKTGAIDYIPDLRLAQTGWTAPSKTAIGNAL